MPQLKFDEASVRNAALPKGKRQVIFWDTRTKGLGLLVGATTKTFIYQRDLPDGPTRRVTLGRYPEITLTDARHEAARKHADMINGIDPAAARRAFVKEQQRHVWETFTLKQALEHHLLDMDAKGCQKRSMDGLTEELNRHLSEWMSRPLVDITPEDCITRHRRLTIAAGPYLANRVLREFRACHNSARRLHRDLPECPATAVRYNAQERRREPVENLTDWWGRVQSIDNPIRRDYQVFVLLTGLRATDATQVRFSEVDWDAGTLTRPSPKGGTKRAFTIPLSAYVLAMLARRKLENQILYSGADWAFPTRDRSGKLTHIQEPKEQRYARDENAKVHKVKFLPTPHRLRDTFISICETEASVDPITTKALVNHRLPGGDVTTGYVRPSMSHMRVCTERVTAVLLRKAGVAQGVAEQRIGA